MQLCIMVVDSDEWSQVHIINMLTRYARAHFLNPNTAAEEVLAASLLFFPCG